MKTLLNERRAHRIHSLREYAIVVLRFLGVERTDENIMLMVDKLIDILIELKPSDVVFDERGNIHPRTKIPYIRESKKNIMKKNIKPSESKLQSIVKKVLKESIFNLLNRKNEDHYLSDDMYPDHAGTSFEYDRDMISNYFFGLDFSELTLEEKQEVLNFIKSNSGSTLF